MDMNRTRDGQPITCQHSQHYGSDGLPTCKGEHCKGETIACGQGLVPCARHPRTIVYAEPYDARQCPICEVWVYTAAGPFAEGDDPTKTLADYLHWAAEHADPAELGASVVGFPYFGYNEVPVEAVAEHRPVR
jgi:hypothetical protein